MCGYVWLVWLSEYTDHYLKTSECWACLAIGIAIPFTPAQKDCFESLRARDAAACAVGARAYWVLQHWVLGNGTLPDPRDEKGLEEL